MPNKSSSINLVKSEKSDVLERVINWLLSVGRILVVVTELIALGAFLWRFGLDQQIIDLHTKIKQKEAIVAAFKQNEQEYRNLQDRLKLASNFTYSTNNKLDSYKGILDIAPADIAFNKLSQATDRLTMEINVNSVSALSNFVSALKSDRSIESVSIDKIETKTSKAIIVVGITVILKPLKN